jgi:hypothetical protein
VLVNLSGIVLQAPDNMASLVFVSMFDKLYHRVSSQPNGKQRFVAHPSRRFRKKNNADERQDRKDNLQGDREAKLGFTLVIRETVV